MHPAAAKISVLPINGFAKEVLDYKVHEAEGRSVIAVGGNKLSRGLTLEGLSISYFLRTSRMYDTLMQMGRWFGYRFKLCRPNITVLQIMELGDRRFFKGETLRSHVSDSRAWQQGYRTGPD